MTAAVDKSGQAWGVYEFASIASPNRRGKAIARLLDSLIAAFPENAELLLLLRRAGSAGQSELQLRLASKRRERELLMRLPSASSIWDFDCAGTPCTAIALPTSDVSAAADVAASWTRLGALFVVGIQGEALNNETVNGLTLDPNAMSEAGAICGLLPTARRMRQVCAMPFGAFDDRVCGLMVAGPVGLQASLDLDRIDCGSLGG